jgi:orotidine-5'-phosphate decarboxylase
VELRVYRWYKWYENWRKGGMAGYQDQDFEAVIDLKVQDISSITANFFTRFSLLDFDASICAVYFG